MLNKLQFNNLIISNKKKIQQARSQAINKLVQKIRKLKSMLEKRPDDVKNKERLRKTTENMEELKKLKCVEIVRRTLLLDKAPSAIITNGRATPEEIAIAMLALNKIMQDLNKRFKEELKLDEADESWKEEIMQTSSRQTKIIRTEEKRRKRKDLKEQKAMERKRVEWIQENNPEAALKKVQDVDANETNDADEDLELSTIDARKVEPLLDQEEVKKQNAKEKRKPAIQTKPETKNKRKVNQETKKVKPQSNGTPENELMEPTNQTPKKRSKIEEKHRIELKPRNVDNTPTSAEVECETTSDDVTHVVDPFFFTDSGENYLSTAVIVRSNEPQQQTNGSALTKSDEFRYDRKSRNENSRNRTTNNNSNARVTKQPPQNRSKWNQQEPSSEADSKNLHPSWAAKQKMKPIISDFQGKKITFNDDGSTPSAPPKAQANNKIKNVANKNAATQNVAPTEQLHPSWAAKQKLKPTITAFQGKKITFDDDA